MLESRAPGPVATDDCIDMTTDGALCVIDAEGVLRFANGQLRLVLGLSSLGWDDARIHPEDAARLAELAPGELTRCPVRFPSVAGGWVRISLDCHAFDGGSGRRILAASPRLSLARNFRSAAGEANIGVFVTRYGRFVYVNAAFTRLTGYRSRDLIGRRALDLVVPADRRALLRNAARVLTGDRWFQYEYRIRAADGSVRRLTESLAPLVLAGERATLGACIDVTGWHATAGALREGGQRLAEHLANSPDMLALTGPAGRFLYVNDAHAQVLGYKPRELIGVLAFNLVHPDDLAELQQAIHDWGVGSDRPPLQLRAQHKSGRWLWLQTYVETIRDTRGVRTGTVIISRDITRQRQLEQELQSLAQELRAPTEGLAAFAYRVAHGEPGALVLLSAYAQLLARRYAAEQPADTDAFIRAVGHETARLQSLIAELLAANHTHGATAERRAA